MESQKSLELIKNLTMENSSQKLEIEKLTFENKSIQTRTNKLQSQLITNDDLVDKRLVINLIVSLFGRNDQSAASGREVLNILASLLKMTNTERHKVRKLFVYSFISL